MGIETIVKLRINIPNLQFSRLPFVERESSRSWIVSVYVCMYGLDTFLTNFGALYLTEFLTDLGQILDSNSYDHAQQTLWYHTTPKP